MGLSTLLFSFSSDQQEDPNEQGYVQVLVSLVLLKPCQRRIFEDRVSEPLLNYVQSGRLALRWSIFSHSVM